jgi:hypothetical protein
MDVGSGDANDKLSEVAHSRQEMAVAGFGDGGTGAPEVTVEDKHRSGNGPAKQDFAVVMDALVSQDTVGAFTDPINGVLVAARPEKAHPDAEQGFVDTKMAANGATMEDTKDEAAQRCGNNN